MILYMVSSGQKITLIKNSILKLKMHIDKLLLAYNIVTNFFYVLKMTKIFLNVSEILQKIQPKPKKKIHRKKLSVC